MVLETALAIQKEQLSDSVNDLSLYWKNKYSFEYNDIILVFRDLLKRPYSLYRNWVQLIFLLRKSIQNAQKVLLWFRNTHHPPAEARGGTSESTSVCLATVKSLSDPTLNHILIKHTLIVTHTQNHTHTSAGQILYTYNSEFIISQISAIRTRPRHDVWAWVSVIIYAGIIIFELQ